MQCQPIGFDKALSASKGPVHHRQRANIGDQRYGHTPSDFLHFCNNS